MGLETGTFISDLVDTNPLSTDKKRQGDDHIRLIKDVVQNTLPNASKAFYFPTAVSKTANFTVTAAEMNKTFMVSTSAGEVTATLPTLAASDDGWQCHFIKTNTGLNALFIAPAAGTLTSGEISGLAQCRRVIPGHRCSARWDGSAWYVSRVPNAPVGTILDFVGATVPVGYEFAYGQTLASASTKYPEFYSVNGNSGVAPDLRGRVVAGQDDMGGSSANRLTGLTGGVDGDTLGAAGGAETNTLTTAKLPAHSHSITDPGHTHPLTNGSLKITNIGGGSAGASGSSLTTQTITVDTATTGINATDNAGGGEAHNNVQPTIVLNKILVVE